MNRTRAPVGGMAWSRSGCSRRSWGLVGGVGTAVVVGVASGESAEQADQPHVVVIPVAERTAIVDTAVEVGRTARAERTALASRAGEVVRAEQAEAARLAEEQRRAEEERAARAEEARVERTERERADEPEPAPAAPRRPRPVRRSVSRVHPTAVLRAGRPGLAPVPVLTALTTHRQRAGHQRCSISAQQP